MTAQRDDAVKPQIRLPGQSGVAEGAHDHSGMYVMHYAFRRDLATFTAAAQRTPLTERSTWRAMRKRWDRFVEILHHHHRAEDEYYWPVLRGAAAARGTAADLDTLDAMEGEHAAIDPALAQCTSAFDEVLASPGEEERSVLVERLTSLHGLLEGHLSHEEGEALPLVQRVMTGAEFAQVERGVSSAYGLRIVPFLLPWCLHGLPQETKRTFLADAGQPFKTLHAVTRPRFERTERRTFTYATAAG